MNADLWTVIGDPIGSQDDGFEFGVDLIVGALTNEQFIGLMPPINPITPAYQSVMEMQVCP